jgi:hypothetical protein
VDTRVTEAQLGGSLAVQMTGWLICWNTVSPMIRS